MADPIYIGAVSQWDGAFKLPPGTIYYWDNEIIYVMDAAGDYSPVGTAQQVSNYLYADAPSSGGSATRNSNIVPLLLLGAGAAFLLGK